MTTNWPPGVGHVHLGETDSTNSAALQAVRDGQPCPFWLTADRQTAGRGRRGRAWLGGEGNFFGTLALRPSG